MASVRQLPEPSKKTGKRPWVVTYTDPKTGKRHQATPPSGLKRDAEKMRVKIEEELAKGIHVAPSQSITISEALDQWLEEIEKRVKAKDNVRPLTLKNWRNLANLYVRQEIGHVMACDVTIRMVQAWVNDLSLTKGKGRPSVVHAVSILRKVLRHCEFKGYVSRNILVRGEIRIPGRVAKPIAIPTKQQVRDLLEASGKPVQGGPAPYLRPILHVAVYSGLRLGEIRALTWECIDFEAQTITVKQGMDPFGNVDEPKTHASNRIVPMPAPLVQELKIWNMRCGRPATGSVFNSRTGAFIKESAISISWRRLMRRVFKGVAKAETPDRQSHHFHFHALRHVYASLLIESGLPPKRVQYLMGHASITMTFDRYGHLFEDPDLVREAMERFGNAISKPL